jgi:hypothetical protein
MSYVDIDGTNNATFSSSSDSLTLPNCSEILWAGLYWGGRIAANTTNYATRNQIKVKVGNGIYQPFTADQTLDVPTINGANWSHPSYFCFKNITPLVVSSGLNARLYRSRSRYAHRNIKHVGRLVDCCGLQKCITNNA